MVPAMSTASKSVTRRAGFRRSVTALTASVLLLIGLVAAAGVTDAADGRVFEMTKPIPERGYWLPGDTIGFKVECLEGEDYERVWNDELGDGAYAGGDGWGQTIDPWAPVGTYEWVLECRDDGGKGDVVDSWTFTAEVRPATSLVATVGTVAGECATTNEITVEEGTEVHWCYRLLPDEDLDGDLFDDWSWDELTNQIADTANGHLGFIPSADLFSLPEEGVTSVQFGRLSSTVVTADIDSTGTWMTSYGYYDDEEDEMEWKSLLDVEDTASVKILSPADPGPAGPAAPAAPVAITPSYTG